MLKDKEDEISKSKKELRQAKKDVIKEYRDFDALLAELGSSFVDDFDDFLYQVKASFPDLDLSHITIDVEGQISARPIDFEGTDELFEDDTTSNPQGDKEAAPHDDQTKSIDKESRPLEGNQMVEEKDGETLANQT